MELRKRLAVAHPCDTKDAVPRKERLRRLLQGKAAVRPMKYFNGKGLQAAGSSWTLHGSPWQSDWVPSCRESTRMRTSSAPPPNSIWTNPDSGCSWSCNCIMPLRPVLRKHTAKMHSAGRGGLQQCEPCTFQDLDGLAPLDFQDLSCAPIWKGG